jgi:hypothetical protein
MLAIEKIIEALIKVGGETPGKVNDVYMSHDDGCPALKTNNIVDCTCDPDIKVRAQG